MLCDVCKCGRNPEDLYEVEVYGCKFWVCYDCKEDIKRSRVRP